MKTQKALTIIFATGFIALAIVLFSSDSNLEKEKSKYFYDTVIDSNQQSVEFSREIFTRNQVIDLQTYEISELNVKLSDLEYFQKKYEELGIGEDKASPSDRIGESNIKISSGRIILTLDEPVQIGSIADTNSMDPLLDAGSNTIKVMPYSEKNIKIGDIITYSPAENPEKDIIHRVVFTGYDSNGWYAIAKGDNNPVQDPEKIRFNQITGILIAIIY